ncbi:PIR protein [Plasmodium ovale]|uniref:PIR Superfamily Protein n=2 Tax=Plasmodium ovale TaxID=36330 RepID=A0A1A8XB41_PLAOA|nr:PIR Superfamily Protein [Plasmodium ovale curtisi]SBT84735.1 PIR protein [Plasmodium ovale]
MSTHTFNFTYDEFKEKNYPSLKTIKFGRIYDEFNNTHEIDISVQQKCTKAKAGLPINDIYDELSKNFCYNLYKIIVIVNNLQNDIFNGIDKDDNMNCLYLKYWLYENIENLGPKGLSVETFFQSLKNKLEVEISSVLPNLCTFNKLNSTEIDKIRSIYAFLLIYYRNLDKFYDDKLIECKYLNYFGKGLKAYYESITKCSDETNEENYCKEFNELLKIYNIDKIYWKNSTNNTEYNYMPDSNADCPLAIESLKNPLRLIYQEKNNTLHLSDQPIVLLNNSIISVSSAMGATVGISSFLLYLFKFTNFRSLFGRGKQRDNTIFLNEDEGTHGLTFPISELEHTNFGNSEYKISYHSVGNS